MNRTDNPYQAPASRLAEQRGDTSPTALKIGIALYLIVYGCEVASALPLDTRVSWPYLGLAGTTGLFSLIVCVALWRGKQWARIWVVFSTFLPLFMLLVLLRRGIWDEQWLQTTAVSLRITMAAMMLLPSVRRWFAPKA